jgi:hypothetical protein
VFGLGGLAVTLLDRQRASARPLALGGVLVVGVLLADFDGLTDVFYPLVFTAVGVGIVVSYLPRRVGVSAVILLGILVMPAFAPTGLFNPDPVELEPTDGTPPALGSERESVYWTNQSIQSCHFFASGTQRSVLEYYPADVTLADLPCGNLDFYWAMTRHRLLDHPRPTATEIPSTKPSGPSQPSASTPAQTSTPAPTQTSTPTPTPTPQYIVVDDVLDYRVDDNATVVTVPVANRAKAEHTVGVVATVTLDREPHQRCKQITLAGSEQRTLRFRFGDVDPDTGDVSIEIRIEDIDSETACE